MAVALALALILLLLLLLLAHLFCSLLCRRRRRRENVEAEAPSPSLAKPAGSVPFYAHGVLHAPKRFLLSVPSLEVMLPPEASPSDTAAGHVVFISNPVYDAARGGGDGGRPFEMVAEEEEGERSPPLKAMKKLPSALPKAVPAVSLVDGRRSLATSASATETNRASFSSESLCLSPAW